MFPPEELRVELRDKFLICGMDKPDTRKNVLELIPAEIKLGIISGETDTTAVLNIVKRCMEFEDGIEQLAFALRQVIGGTALVGELDVFIRKLSHIPVSYAERRKLLHFASEMQWPADVLRKAYQRSIPDGWEPPDFSEVSDVFASMLRDLVKTGRQNNGTFLVFEFVERLALYAQNEENDSMRSHLQEWVKWRAFELGVHDNAVSQMRARIKQEDVPRLEKVPYLLVMLDTSSAESETTDAIENRAYSVQAWLVDEQSRVVTEPVPIEDVPRKLEEMPELLGYLLEQYLSVESLMDSIDDLVIEFLVPDELLNYGFDSWQVRLDDDEHALGVRFKVVVRSTKRAMKRLYWPAWRKKWTFLQDALKVECPSEGFVCICNSDQCQVGSSSSCTVLFCGRTECHNQERLHAVLRGSSIVYLALTHAGATDSITSTDAARDGNRVFRTILQAGMPIALWPRKRINSAEPLASLLSYDALHSLPRKVWEWRKNVTEDREESATEQQLSLLWDDPFRLPPAATAAQFGAPTRNE